MQYSLQVFEYEDRRQFRVIDRNGEPWFVLTDVCRELEIGNPSDAARRLDDDERDALDIVDPIGRLQKTNIINESGLYSLIPARYLTCPSCCRRPPAPGPGW
jgi:prophage antirepressor-like protein